MTIDGSSSTTTRLLTLLNVSATKANKRQRVYIEENQPTEKLNKKRATQFSLEADVIPSSLEADASKEADAPADLADEPEEEAEDTFGESLCNIPSTIGINVRVKTPLQIHTKPILVFPQALYPNMLEMP